MPDRVLRGHSSFNVGTIFCPIVAPEGQHPAMNDFEVPYRAYQAVFIQPWQPINFFDVF
jgi:hypothetical protein